MKLIAKDIGVPVLALAQLNRACETREDKRPLLADLRESGSIEADADIVAMLYRGEVYDSTREDLRGKAELLVRKHRGGPTGMVPLVWMANIVRFESAADGEWGE
jgi:replicative DNA helicase